VSRLVGLVFLTSACALGLSGCATSRSLTQAMELCMALHGPDADKGEGEVRFWLQAARAGASRQLWNSGGRQAIERRLASAASPLDRACLLQLRLEAAALSVEPD